MAGNVYEGDFINNKRTGKGVYRWANGDVYEGDSLDGERTGKGVYRWANGDVYEGDWLDGYQTGKGVFRWANGDVETGEFLDNSLIKGCKEKSNGELILVGDVFGSNEQSTSYNTIEEKHVQDYYYMNDYFPKNKYDSVPNEVVEFRKFIYNFKDGRLNNKESSRKVSLFIKEKLENTRWLSQETVFIPIPASTKDKTRIRLQEFSKLISMELGVKNGYNQIERFEDRERMRFLGHGINRLTGLKFHDDGLLNRKVILFDDVYTSGASFNELKNELLKIGVKKVTGIFLAKTYDSYAQGEPEWLDNRTNDFGFEDDDLPF